MGNELPRIDLDTYDELIRLIYDAALDDSYWSTFLNKLAACLNATSGLLRVQDIHTNQVGAYITHNIDPNYQQLYKEPYVQIDPFLQLFEEQDPGIVVQTVSHLPEDFKKGEFYNDYATPQNMHNSAGLKIIQSDSIVALLGVHRSEKCGYFEKREIELLERLQPHLQRAAMINGHLLQLNNRFDSVSNALDQLSIGVILVDSSDRPVLINSQAKDYVSGQYGLIANTKGFYAQRREDEKALKAIIAQTKASPPKGGVLSITGNTWSAGLNITVIPVSTELAFNFGLNKSKVTAALFVGEKNRPIKLSVEWICKLYNLSRAEARLARELAGGSSLDEIANKFNLSKHTVRSQLKACFEKTGVNQQSQLVKLILSDPSSLLVKDN